MAIETMRIRNATTSDLGRINDIYNHYVVNTPVTFDLVEIKLQQRVVWFEQFSHDGPHQLLVAEEDGRVVGCSWGHAFRPKQAYDTTVETSVYLAHDAIGRGLGTQLYEALFERLRGHDLRIAIAGITLPNEASVALHKRFGFEPAGVMHEVGRKFEKYWDVAWYEKRLGS
jgi:phosphinothricin acetyltransferase